MDNLKLTLKGEKFIQEYMGRVKDSNKFRINNLSVKLFLSVVPKDLEKNKAFCPFTNGRYNGLKTEILGTKFFYYGCGEAIVYVPDIFGDNRDELLDKLHSFIHQIIDVIQREFNIKVEGFECYKLATGHISLLGKLKNVKGYYKSGRFVLDCSHNNPEVESEDVDAMFEDIDKLLNFKGGIKNSKNDIKSPITTNKTSGQFGL